MLKVCWKRRLNSAAGVALGLIDCGESGELFVLLQKLECFITSRGCAT